MGKDAFYFLKIYFMFFESIRNNKSIENWYLLVVQMDRFQFIILMVDWNDIGKVIAKEYV